MPKGRLFKSDRPDGRFVSTMGATHYAYRNLTPKLAFDPKMSSDEFVAWQRAVRSRLRRTLNFPKTAEQPTPKRLWAKKREGYVLEKWECYPAPGSVAPALLLVPDGAGPKRRAPLVLCFPGTDHSKEMSAGEPEAYGCRRTDDPKRSPERNRMGWWYAQQGMAALCVDNPGTCELGEPAAPGRTELSLHLLWLGWSYLGLSSFIAMTHYRWARALPFVDRKRIAVSGHSLGTGPAAALAVLEPRIRALVYNGNLSSRRAAAVSKGLLAMPPWHYTPRLLEWFDLPDLLAAVAPRPVLVCEGGLADSIRTVRRAYRLHHATGRFKVHHFARHDAAARRRTAGRRVPEGLTAEEFKKWTRMDSARHYFKEDIAVPWLAGHLRNR